MAVFVLTIFLPTFHQSIFFRLGRKFEFLYLCGNTFVYVLITTFIFEDGLNHVFVLSFVLLISPSLLSLIAMDAWSSKILSERPKILILFCLTVHLLIDGSLRSLTSQIEDQLYGSNKQILFFGQSWKLNNINATILWNFGCFFGRILVQMIHYPGHYTILRSIVKQKSYRRY